MSEQLNEIEFEVLKKEIRLRLMRETAQMIAKATRDRFPDKYRTDREFSHAWSDFAKEVLRNTFGDHSQSFLWLFSELFHGFEPTRQETLSKVINLEDAQETINALAQEKIADGIVVAEVAGDEYAKLIHQLGGHSASWRSKEFQQLSHGEKPNIKNTNALCGPENATDYFKSNGYDYFLAVGYGNLNQSDLQAVADKLLKSDRQGNVWITRDQYGSIESFVRS